GRRAEPDPSHRIRSGWPISGSLPAFASTFSNFTVHDLQRDAVRSRASLASIRAVPREPVLQRSERRADREQRHWVPAFAGTTMGVEQKSGGPGRAGHSRSEAADYRFVRGEPVAAAVHAFRSW